MDSMELESFELVILRRPAQATEYDEETTARSGGTGGSARGRGDDLVVPGRHDGTAGPRGHDRRGL